MPPSSSRRRQSLERYRDNFQRTHNARQNPADDDAIRRQMEAQARTAAYAGRVEDLEKELAEAKAAALLDGAQRRMLGLRRAYGSLRREYDEDVERIAEAAAAVVDGVRRLNARYPELTRRYCEALVLNEAFGLPLPEDVRPASPPFAHERARTALASVAAAKLADARQLPRRLADAPYRSGANAWSVDRVLKQIKGTPTAELVEQAGGGILNDAAAWDARHQQEHEARSRRQDAARLTEIRRYDEWLAAQLEDGPVLLEDLKRRAESEGMRWTVPAGDANPDACVSAAAAFRTGAYAVVREGAGREAPWYWTLEPWPGFIVAEESSPLAGMRSY